MRLERKHFALSEIKAGEGAGSFTGKASVYGVVDSYGDIVMPGAFSKTLAQKGNRIKVLAQHNPDDVIGLATLSDSSDALLAVGSLVLDLPSAKDMYTRLTNGLIDGISIGYTTGNATYDKNGLRQLNEIDLWEISLVTFPANDYARVTDVKSLVGDEVEQDAFIARVLAEYKAGRRFSASTEAIIRGIGDSYKAHGTLIEKLTAMLEEVEDSKKTEQPEHKETETGENTETLAFEEVIATLGGFKNLLK